VRAQCVACVQTLLAEDKSGEATLEVVVFVQRLVKGHNNGLGGSVHPDVCRAVLACDLKGDLKDSKSLEAAKVAASRKKKARKAGDDVALGLDESSAVADPVLRRARNAEALRELFTMFLRVLKKAPSSPLTPTVLRGVGRYVHLVNLDIAQALVQVLTQLIKEDVLDLEAGMQSVHTIAVTLRGPGSALAVDESEFVAYLYRALLRLCSAGEPERESYVPLAVRCVEAIFLGRKLYQHSRVPAVVARLCVLANVLSPHAALATLAAVRELMARYGAVCRPLLENEAEVGEGSGSLQALGLPPPEDAGNVDPAFAAADASVLWPLAQLTFHYHPFVREFARRALRMDYLVPAERPQSLFDAYNPYRDGGFNPPVEKRFLAAHAPQQRKHDKRGGKGKANKTAVS
jgi:hypothetical protein